MILMNGKEALLQEVRDALWRLGARKIVAGEPTWGEDHVEVSLHILSHPERRQLISLSVDLLASPGAFLDEVAGQVRRAVAILCEPRPAFRLGTRAPKRLQFERRRVL